MTLFSHPFTRPKPVSLEEYLPSDFPESKLWLRRKHSPEYSSWAAHQANLVATATLKREFNAKDLLISVAVARSFLELGLSDIKYDMYRPPLPLSGDPRNFGSPRMQHNSVFHFPQKDKESESPVLTHYQNRAEEGLSSISSQQLKRLDEQLFKPNQNVFSSLDRDSIQYRENHYETLGGEKIIASSIVQFKFKNGKQIHTMILHPPAADSMKIVEDVVQRLTSIENQSITGEQAKTQFIKALYGYYVAVPHDAGSSSIGRSFFPGFYQGIFHKKMPTKLDGVDMLAMTAHSQATFEKEFAEYLDKP